MGVTLLIHQDEVFLSTKSKQQIEVNKTNNGQQSNLQEQNKGQQQEIQIDFVYTNKNKEAIIHEEGN